MGRGILDLWLALVVGNSRLHWGIFEHHLLVKHWDTPHYSDAQMQSLKAGNFAANVWSELGVEAIPTQLKNRDKLLPLWLASVVDGPQQQLRDYPALMLVDLSQVPLQQSYATLGIDRALVLLGAGDTYGWPVLVIDGGTALTFTAGESGRFWGGAILPGLGLQGRALHEHTDRLPQVSFHDQTDLPARWARTTPAAILSGIVYTQLAGIQSFIADWQRQFPGGQVVLTGGDGALIGRYLSQLDAELADSLKTDPHLAFWGLRVCRQAIITAR